MCIGYEVSGWESVFLLFVIMLLTVYSHWISKSVQMKVKANVLLFVVAAAVSQALSDLLS